MKNKLILISTFLLLGLLATGAKIVLAQTMPRISTVCEGPLGVLLSKDNGDGFSRIKTCPRGMREVVLGEVANNSGPIEISEDILFAYYYDPAGGMAKEMMLLFKNGDVYSQQGSESDWELKYTIPESIMKLGIREWRYDYLRTIDDGKIYYRESNESTEWIPLNNLPIPTI